MFSVLQRGRGGWGDHKTISKECTYWVLNMTAHFLQQSQKVSLYPFLLNLWINYCSLLWGFGNLMTLITFQIPTTPQSIKHLLETTLFLKQSNWPQSKINPAITVYGTLKFQRYCVATSTPPDQLCLQLSIQKQCDIEKFLAESEWKARKTQAFHL